MKKEIIDFQKVQYRTRHLPKISMRITGQNVAYKSDAKDDDDDDDDDDPEEEREKLLKVIEKRTRKLLAGRAAKEDVDNIAKQLTFLSKGKNEKGEEIDSPFPIETLREMADPKSGAMAKLVEMGLKVQKLENDIQKAPKDISIRSQCEAFLKKNEAIIKAKKYSELPEFEVRVAASPMLPSTVMPGGTTYINRFEVQPGINELLRAEPTFWDTIRKGTTGSETYIWVNKRTTDGAAGFIGPGVYKPAVSFTVNTEISNAKKIAVNEKMATELFEDIDGFTSWVTTELYYQLMIAVNTALQGNTARTSTVPAGIQTLSVAYNPLTGVATTNPNFWDAIKAGVTQLRVTRFRGQIFAYVNPVDLANGVMTKANVQGQLFVPPVTGATIIEDLNMALGYVQFIAVDYYKILIYKAFRMEWGLEMDDLTKNLRTVIAEMRLHEFHSQNHDGFAIYDSLANIQAAITAV